MKKYKIKFNENQLVVMVESLEILYLLGMKQYSKALSHIETESGKEIYASGLLNLERLIRDAEKCDLEYEKYYSIYSPKVSDRFKIAWCLNQILIEAKQRVWGRTKFKIDECVKFEFKDFIKNIEVNYDDGYEIIVNQDQLEIIERALDMFSRLGLKQYHNVLDQIETNTEFGCFSYEASVKLERQIRLEEGSQLDDNGSWGIYCHEISDKYRVAWDLQQVFRYVRSWANAEDKPEDRNKIFSKYIGVNYDDPRKSGKDPLAECEEII